MADREVGATHLDLELLGVQTVLVDGGLEELPVPRAEGVGGLGVPDDLGEVLGEPVDLHVVGDRSEGRSEALLPGLGGEPLPVGFHRLAEAAEGREGAPLAVAGLGLARLHLLAEPGLAAEEELGGAGVPQGRGRLSHPKRGDALVEEDVNARSRRPLLGQRVEPVSVGVGSLAKGLVALGLEVLEGHGHRASRRSGWRAVRASERFFRFFLLGSLSSFGARNVGAGKSRLYRL